MGISIRYRWLAGGLAAAGLVVAVLLSFDGGNPGPAPVAVDDPGPGTTSARDEVPVVADDPAPPPADLRPSTSERSSPATGGSAYPSSPAVGPATPAGPTDPDTDPGPDPWTVYTEQTRAIVSDHADAAISTTGAVVDALAALDPAALGAMLAPDEGTQTAYLTALAARYPEITTSAVGGNVDVFAQGPATIYVAYALVTWEDGGITSSHTIPVPLRFVDGTWYLTCLFDTGGELVPVTTVEL